MSVRAVNQLEMFAIAPAVVEAKPFLKWIGGKRQLLPEIRKRMPPTFGRYFEPFMGGAALFFDRAPGAGSYLSDVNERLVRTYRGVRDHVEDVIDLLSTYPYERAFYETMRATDVDILVDACAAAWFIYVNRAGFNGIYRVNQTGKFNVPFGRYDNPTICDAPTLRACSAALAGVDIHHRDFCAVEHEAAAGDFVYFDPPYVPLSVTSSFVAYSKERFGEEKQLELRDLAARLVARGVHVLLSNSSAPAVHELYAGPHFRVEEVDATRSVNSAPDKRGAIKEVLITGVAP